MEQHETMKHPLAKRRIDIATWVCRICFALVFLVNIHCALSYVFMPESFAGGFQLSGVPGMVAVQGIGIAFLMWNATYPAFIVNPRRFKVVGVVILVQQIIGLVGESAIYLGLKSAVPFMLPGAGDVVISAAYSQLAESILRFIQFDALGLIIMGVSFAYLFCACKRVKA